jgi:hypothetical protein
MLGPFSVLGLEFTKEARSEEASGPSPIQVCRCSIVADFFKKNSARSTQILARHPTQLGKSDGWDPTQLETAALPSGTVRRRVW